MIHLMKLNLKLVLFTFFVFIFCYGNSEITTSISTQASVENAITGKYFQPVILNGNIADESNKVHMFTVKIEPITTDSIAAESHCTGELIAPDIVLTAGHCVDENTKEIKISYGLPTEGKFDSFEFSKDFRGRNGNSILHSNVKKVRALFNQEGRLDIGETYQELSLSIYKNRTKLVNYGDLECCKSYLDQFPDYAVIRVKKVPKYYRPIKFYEGKLNINQLLYTIGYGVNSLLQSSTKNRPLSWSESRLVGYFQPKGLPILGFQTYSPTKQNVCVGDSGGPLVIKIKNVFSLVGVISFVNNNCEGSAWHFNPLSFIDQISEDIRILRATKSL